VLPAVDRPVLDRVHLHRPGNVAAAICSASFSNILGIVLTPVLVAVFLVTRYGGISWGSVRDIMLQLMVPFLAGQLLRR